MFGIDRDATRDDQEGRRAGLQKRTKDRPLFEKKNPTTPRNGTTGMRPPTHSFRGFAPNARRLLRELADRQDRDWFLANKRDYDARVRGPLADLVEALDARFRRASVPLRGHPQRSLLPVSLDRRPGDRRPRYRAAAVAVMTTFGERRTPCSLKIEVESDAVHVAFGFHRVDRLGGLDTVLNSIATDEARWVGIEQILSNAGLRFDRPLVPCILQAASKSRSKIDLMAKTRFGPERFSVPTLVDDITDLAVAATPFLQLGSEFFKDAVGRRLEPGVNSLGF